MGETVRLTAGTIKVPDTVLRTLGLKDGDTIEFFTNAAGAFEIRKPGRSFEDLRGIVTLDRPVTGEELDAWIAEGRRSGYRENEE